MVAPVKTPPKNVYGDKGNRWWVGLNTAVNNKTVFGTQSPVGGGEIFNPAPSGYESLPSGNATDDALFTAAAKKNAVSGAKPVTISVENINWYNITGPYPTQARANTAIPAIQKANPAPGVVQSAANALGVGGVLSWEQSIQNFIGDLTSQNLWIRVAKIVFGGGMLLLGIAKLTGADQKIGGVVHKATKLAPLL